LGLLKPTLPAKIKLWALAHYHPLSATKTPLIMSKPRLEREEYVEQAYFFRVYRERLQENTPSQEILAAIREEILATTKLPMAIDFLKDEVKHTGKLSTGMAHLPHYFSAFQTFVMECAEAEKGKFDQIIAFKILEHEAGYLIRNATPAGLFIYQFECLARNRLGYDRGLEAIASDPIYDDDWRAWIRQLRRELGAVEFADLIYRRSEHYQQELRRKKRDENFTLPFRLFFGTQEGRIAKANLGKDPLYMFAALQRQLDYPAIPTRDRRDTEAVIHPVLQERLKRLEQRIKILEMETQGKLDLSQFYAKPPDFTDPNDPPTHPPANS
jgi:hypothetical protein